MIRVAVWGAIGAVVVLVTRVVVYALAPWQSVALTELEHRAGGPHLATLLGAAVSIAAAAAVAVLWIAVVAVRERLALEPRVLSERPRLSIPRLALRLVTLFSLTCVVFGMLESYVHWRAGLGWHGIHCLTGPVHRDAIPILGAFSLLAVALHGAVEHLLAWVRRLVGLLAAQAPLLRGRGKVFSSTARPRVLRTGRALAARGPPVGSSATT